LADDGSGGKPVKARSWWLKAAGAVLVAAAAGGLIMFLVVKHGTLGRRADLAAGYVAHVVCSCHYVGKRDMKSCATDFEPGMEIVRMEDDPAAKRITAWVPLLAKHTATYTPEYGCALDAR
jgi:hypothetical protein